MIELNKIYNEDCLEGMKRIPDNSIDLVVTDPPYILDVRGGGFFGEKSDNYGGDIHVMKEISSFSEGFNESVLNELCRVMKKINIYLWCSQKQIMQYLEYFVTRKKCNWNILSWHKSNCIPACGNKYVTDTEFCLFFRDKRVKLYGNYKTKATYYITAANQKDKKKWHHPTIKPLHIIQNLVTNSSLGGGQSLTHLWAAAQLPLLR